MTFGSRTISSLQNPRVKDARRLRERRERRKRGVFCVEGAREINRALTSGYRIEEFFVCPELYSDEAYDVIARVGPEQTLEVSPEVYDKIVVRKGHDGLFAVFREVRRDLKRAELPAKPLVVAMDDVEKPGNLGAVIRTADGAGADAVVVLGDRADPYNPNVIRASLGTVFTMPVFTDSPVAFQGFCRERGMRIIVAALAEGGKAPYDVDLTGGVALVLGSEDEGLSPEWISRADEVITIPMAGKADSLNVSAAGAVLLYEAYRQRRS